MYRYIVFIFLIISIKGHGQNCSTTLHIINSNHEAIPYCSVHIDDSLSLISDQNGLIVLENMDSGEHYIAALSLLYSGKQYAFTVNCDSDVPITIHFEPGAYDLNAMVVTGSKTYQTRLNNAILVGVTDAKQLESGQACNLGEGLKFQPGLRVETNCQTCNYSQVRINGLSGGYSQILINGRPIFSPLTGLYGLDQIPTSMIDRIEVVRGGGSSLYGSSAIGGTINIITKKAKNTRAELEYFHQLIGGSAADDNANMNVSLVHPSKAMGLNIFGNHRTRRMYDANGDNFSEISELKTNSVGANAYFEPTSNQKLEANVSYGHAYRYGGEMTSQPAYLALQSEERTHKVWMGSLDYQINFNNDKSSLISYLAYQNTGRLHYTGIYPDDSSDILIHEANPPYGTSQVTTSNIGVQLNHQIDSFPLGKNILTLGAEYIRDGVFDQISSYNYLISQNTHNYGAFLQSDWRISDKISLLSGVRADKHNLMESLKLNPRAALLFKHNDYTRVRLNVGTGFRAPQAFDTDLHIAFAGGGISRVQLSPNLNAESSVSYSASFSTDKITDKLAIGATIEGFYTRIQDAFYLKPIGADQYGEVFEKSNGPGAQVYGVSIEGRANINERLEVNSGITIQKSLYDQPIEYIPSAPMGREFARTPNVYGFNAIDFNISGKMSVHLNHNLTGPMIVPHFAGAENQSINEIVKSKSFNTIDFKFNYTLSMGSSKRLIKLYCGVKNILDHYQEQFDIGKNRDSNFIYGPAMPRTYFLGLKLLLNR